MHKFVLKEVLWHKQWKLIVVSTGSNESHYFIHIWISFKAFECFLSNNSITSLTYNSETLQLKSIKCHSMTDQHVLVTSYT